MTPSSKRSSASRGKRAARASSEPSRPSSKPFLRFYHSDSLRKKTLSVLDSLKEAKDATAHRGALADVVVELTRSGMDYYFMKPLERAKVGFILQQSANLSLAGAMRVMESVIRNIIGRMDEPQLLSVGDSIRQLMV